ncbi:hypothetical protein G4G28_09650 [Massilia sp. Dwa41.01b]|uniref:hypothetical protein n=1 Tax=unclassified Massilia TaxID=2609279 RepID=UPI001600190B|nr:MULTISPECIES: hypothetical protein [unclassified Massilia]QNA88686.1 hypothetical protein G4G28_09650 [Massilia sp. Dwa41.01b]QNA99586.1 hypothetical protein G4G31_13325 [Massilia sp. Se16.2.3]
MHIGEVCSIVEAVLVLSTLTKRAWTEVEFTRAVIRLRLPIYAVAPYNASIVSKRYVDGHLVITAEPSMTARYVTLLQAEIEELAYSPGPQVVTDRPAWLWEDQPYQSWDDIVAFRQGDHRVLGHWETDQGEWMGQSEEYFFSKPVQVTAKSTLVVPRHTIAELVRNEAVADLQTATVDSADPLTSLVLAESGQGAMQGILAKNPASSVIPLAIVAEATSPLASPTNGEATSPPQAKKTNTWDQHDLRRLLEESLIEGNTHAVLAEKYGVSRQFIGKQIATAKGLFGARKPSPFDALGSRSRKK